MAAPSKPGIAPGALLQGTYRIVSLIGQGGMGEVYEAAHARLSGRFAVKVLRREVAANPEAFERFRREAETTSALHHPNIVQVVDFNQMPDGTPYLVMEYLEGTNLANRIAREGRQPLRRILQIVDEVSSALGAAHGGGVVHRDLKPENVLLVPVADQDRFFAKVVDFGISKVRSATRRLTQESAIFGTPQYMSPEQALGRTAEIDHRTDQFALAAMTYEMASGVPPFQADEVTAVLYQVAHEPPPPLALEALSLTGEFEQVILRGLAKRPDRRFPRITDFARALEQAAGAGQRAASDPGIRPAAGAGVVGGKRSGVEATVTTLSTAATEATTGVLRRRRTKWLMAGGAAATAVAFGVLALPGRQGADPRSQTPAVAAAGAGLAGNARVVPAASLGPLVVAAPARTVHISVDSSPQVARVMRGNEVLGQTPMTLTFGESRDAIQLALHKSGFRPESVEVVPDSDMKRIFVPLKRLPARRAPVKSATRPAAAAQPGPSRQPASKRIDDI